LWQQLFFGTNFAGSPPAIAQFRQWPVNLVAVMICATFSYYVVEKPFIRLGHKLVSALKARDGFTISTASTPTTSLREPVLE
jgi:peptidoglycan/LPS O-acetylase OafA/YrhL